MHINGDEELLPPRAKLPRWVLVAVVVAAGAVLSVTLYSHRGQSHEATHRPPATRASTPHSDHPRPTTTAASSPAVTPVAEAYPHAGQVPGAQVVALTNRERAEAVLGFVDPIRLPDRLVAGHSYPFTAHLAYAYTNVSDRPLVLTAAASNATLTCPPAFIVQPGQGYNVACTLTPARRTGTLTFSLTGLRPDGSLEAGSVRFGIPW